MITRDCPNCGKSYQADPKRLKYGRQTTCSRECSYAMRGAKLGRDVILKCDVCSKDFTRKPAQHRAKHITVCSWSCYVKARVIGLITPRPPVKPTVTFTCEHCNRTVELPSSRKGARRFRFCSTDCANQSNSGEGNHFWRGGDYPAYYGPNWQRQRRAARKRDGYKCQECGVTEADHGKELDVHHIVRFAAFATSEEANDLANLVSLCHVCHLKTEWQTSPDLRTHAS
jgi:hypothetical protein